jgi:hypothetical protein
MYSMKDLSSEIAERIDNLRASGKPILHPDWITKEVINE